MGTHELLLMNIIIKIGNYIISSHFSSQYHPLKRKGHITSHITWAKKRSRLKIGDIIFIFYYDYFFKENG